MADKLQFVPIDKIIVGERFRVDLQDIDNLAASIREKGVIQPITIQKDFKLRAGGRRIEGAKRAGLDKIPCLIMEDTDEIEAREIELIENTFRQDFTWQERINLIAELHKLMLEKHGKEWGTRRTAGLLGQSHPMNVSRAMQLHDAMDLIPELKQAKTAEEATKLYKKFEEHLVNAELRKRQDKIQDRGVVDALKVANGNYNIGDAMKGMEKLAKNNPHICLIEVDPPYGIDLVEQKKQVDAANRVQTYNEIPGVEYAAFTQILAEETFRVAGQNCWMVYWFGPTYFSVVKGALLQAGWSVDDIPAIWVKGETGQTNAPEVHLARSYEPFFVCRKGRPVLNKRGRSNVFNFTPVPPQKKYHPTERPVALIKELIDVFGCIGQTMLVPFLGSGASLRAAYLTGMRAFGWDLNPEYKDRFLLEIEQDTKALDQVKE